MKDVSIRKRSWIINSYSEREYFKLLFSSFWTTSIIVKLSEMGKSNSEIGELLYLLQYSVSNIMLSYKTSILCKKGSIFVTKSEIRDIIKNSELKNFFILNVTENLILNSLIYCCLRVKYYHAYWIAEGRGKTIEQNSFLN